VQTDRQTHNKRLCSVIVCFSVWRSQQMLLFMRLKKFLIDLISNAINIEQYAMGKRDIYLHARQ